MKRPREKMLISRYQTTDDKGQDYLVEHWVVGRSYYRRKKISKEDVMNPKTFGFGGS